MSGFPSIVFAPFALSKACVAGEFANGANNKRRRKSGKIDVFGADNYNWVIQAYLICRMAQINGKITRICDIIRYWSKSEAYAVYASKSAKVVARG